MSMLMKCSWVELAMSLVLVSASAVLIMTMALALWALFSDG